MSKKDWRELEAFRANKAQWIRKSRNQYVCEKCEAKSSFPANFCHKCGAKMK
jgi:ribosomal protein L40E